MTEHYFLYAFGTAGTLASVPNPTQVSGTVSYQSGFPIGYQTASSDPGYLSIPRDQFNQILYDVTGAIQQMQQTGFPSWITAAANGGVSYSYPLGAEVWYNGVPYRSLQAGNTDTPPTSNWAVIGQSRTIYFNYAADTGSANHYVIAPDPAIAAYAGGDVIQLRPAFGNTGACDINVNSLGVKNIKTLANVDPAAGMINPAGQYQLVYNDNTGCFVLQNPTLGSAAYVNTGTSAGQVPLNSNLGTAAYLNVGTSASQVVQLNGSAQLPAVSAVNLTSIPIYYMQVRQEEASGTASGTFTSGAWQTRILNTTKFNNISGASLASNQFTLPAGTYEINAIAPHYIVSVGQAKIYNVTDSADAIIGQTSANSTADAQSNWSYVRGIITISGTKVFQLQHRCFITRATNGFGPAASFGVNEVYADVIITKLY